MLKAHVRSGQAGPAAALATVFGLKSATTTTGLDFTKKTMTAAWEQANQDQAVTLYALGWTIVPV